MRGNKSTIVGRTKPLLLLVTLTLLPTSKQAEARQFSFGITPGKRLSPFTWTARDSRRQAKRGTPDPGGPGASPPIKTCTEDEQCPTGTYCEADRCAPVKRPINFLYLYYRSGTRRFTQIGGIYWHRRGSRGFRVVVPFYWHFWSPARKTLVVFPLFMRTTEPSSGTTTTLIPPFQWTRSPTVGAFNLWPILFWRRDGVGSRVTVFPLMHYSRNDRQRLGIIAPLITFWHSTQRSSTGMVAGLYFWRRHKKTKTQLVFPLLFHRSNRQRSFAWALPLNFYWRRQNRESLLALPLLYSSSQANSKRAFWLLPPIYYRRLANRRRLFVFPLIWYQRDGKRSLWVAGPFYRRRWHGGSSAGAIPIFFHQSGRRGHTIFFPIFWQFRRPKRTLTITGPFFRYRRGNKRFTGLLPVFLHRSLDNGQRTAFLSPLFLRERDSRAGLHHWALVVPPFYHRRDPDREIDTLFPVFWRWKNRNTGATTWIIPPVVVANDYQGRTQLAFPIFWRFHSAETGKTTSILFPLFYRHSRPDGGSTNLLLPFYYKHTPKRWSAALLPVLFAGASDDRSHAVLFPIFWHLRNKRSRTTVFGPFYYRREYRGGWLAGLAPLWFSGNRDGETHHVLFPFFWHVRSRKNQFRTVVAGPFVWSKGRKGKVTAVLPLFAYGTWRGRNYRAIAPPIYYSSRDVNSGDHTLLAGLFYRFRQGNARGWSVFPFVHYRERNKQRTTVIFPLFYQRRTPGGRLIITPLGGYRRDTQRGVDQLVVGPYVRSKTRNARGFGIIPFLFHWKRPAERSSTTVLLPLGVHHRSPKIKADVLFPIFWRILEPDERNLVLFPVYWRMRARDGRSADVLFPLLWRFGNRKRILRAYGPYFDIEGKQTRTTGLFPLGLYRRNGGRSYLAALPAFYYHHDFKNAQRTWVLGPMYYRRYRQGHALGFVPLLFYKRTPTRSHTIVAPVFWRWSNRQRKTATTFVGPFFFHRKGYTKAFGLAPLFYRSRDRRGQTTTALFPLFYRRNAIDQRAIFTPLFGYERSVTRRIAYGLPYFRMQSKKRNFSILFPLAFYHRNHLKRSSTLFVSPLYYANWSDRRSFHLAFPLFWYHRKIDRRSTVVVPVYWDFDNRRRQRTTVVFPLFVRHRNQVTRSTSYFTAPGVWVRFRPKATDAVVFPVFWRFGGQRRHSTVLFPLYWDFKRAERRSTVLFPFYWRFDRPTHTSYVVFNTYYRRDKRHGTYAFHFIPLFSIERRRPGDLKWEFIPGGLLGYERIGRNRFLTLLFIFHLKLRPTQAQVLGRRTRMVSWGMP